MKDQIDELLENQNSIVGAVKNLNERLEAIEKKMDDESIKNMKDILEGQALIDEVIVKNTDDIALMKKIKQENKDAIKSLEAKIDKLDKEIEKRNTSDQDNESKNQNVEDKNLEKNMIMCRYYNRGHCKKKSQCSYIHPRNICKFFWKDGKCEIRDCCSRHPKNCRYNKKGCFRGLDCDYLHYEFQNENESQSAMNVEHFVE